MKKYQRFSSENFQFLEVKFSIYLNRRVSVMDLAGRMRRLMFVFVGRTCQKEHSLTLRLKFALLTLTLTGLSCTSPVSVVYDSIIEY